jgi:hypothetical protein
MEYTDSTVDFGMNSWGAGLAIDFASVITKIESEEEVQLLPLGSVIGDLHGGLTFTDAVAAALEGRSLGGWQELRSPGGEIWTIIVLNR